MPDAASTCQPAQICIMQWHWAGNRGRWHSFNAEARNQLEAAYQRWLKGDLAHRALRLQLGTISYEIDFEGMVQMNTTSNRHRSIKRELASVTWCWCSGKGRYHAFDAISTFWLEEKYQVWETHGIHKKYHLNVNDYAYEIDFESMTQRNTVSGRERAITRKLENCPRSVGESLSCTVSGTSCAVCGCKTEFDPWGDRMCWCDSCWSTGCSTSSVCWQTCSGSRKATVAPREHLDDRAMQVFRGRVAGDKQLASHSQVRHTGQRHAVLKASLGDDMRRLPTSWPLDASHAEVFAATRLAVRRGFSSVFRMDSMFDLKYMDDDGEVCSLVIETMDDWLSFGLDGILRLVVVHQPSDSIPNPIVSRTLPGEPEATHTIEEEHDFAWELIEPPETFGKTGS